MKYIHDKIFMGENLDFNIFDGIGYTTEENGLMHNHDCLELNYVVKGGGVYHIGDKTYEIGSGDLFIINNCEYHAAIDPNNNLILKVIVFNPEIVWSYNNVLDQQYLKTFFECKDSFKHHIKHDEPMVGTIKCLFYQIQEEWRNKKVGYRLVIKALLLEILAILYRAYESIDSSSQQVVKFQNNFNKIAKVINYIDNNFQNKLCLEELAKLAHMNPNYFSTYFKKVMNVSVVSYIKKKRLENACLLLRTTKTCISDIATSVGFSNISYFNKAFRQHVHFSPSEYREEIMRTK